MDDIEVGSRFMLYVECARVAAKVKLIMWRVCRYRQFFKHALYCLTSRGGRQKMTHHVTMTPCQIRKSAYVMFFNACARLNPVNALWLVFSQALLVIGPT
jgi:hypothetical protein